MKDFLKSKYRVVRDNYLGYEVQVKKWFWPFWIQCTSGTGNITNTHPTLDIAKEFIANRKKHGRRYVVYQE